MTSEASVQVSLSELERFARQVLEAGGLMPHLAEQVAELLVWADARGTPSHGVSRLPMYVNLLRTGEMSGSAEPRVSLKLPALAVLEGDRCAGAVGMNAATHMAITLARQSGIGMCLLRETTHTGALGYYTSRAATAGLVAIAGAASGPNMAYHGAAAAGVSTAPLSIAAPPGSGSQPLVFDMASGVVALGKLQQAKAAGKPIPAGWALDADGRETTDPSTAKTPLPLGGPKGSGLALMMEVVASMLTANPILAPSLASPSSSRHYQNAFLIAIHVDSLVAGMNYVHDVDQLIAGIKGLPTLDGSQVLLPGERGSLQQDASRSNGVTLGSATVKAVSALAGKLNIATPWA